MMMLPGAGVGPAICGGVDQQLHQQWSMAPSIQGFSGMQPQQQYLYPLRSMSHAPQTADGIRTLWVGDLQCWMDATFIGNCFLHTASTPYQSYGTASSQGSSSEIDSNNTTVFARGLHSNVKDQDLRQNLGQYGDLVSVKAPVGKGCGFVQFENRDSSHLLKCSLRMVLPPIQCQDIAQKRGGNRNTKGWYHNKKLMFGGVIPPFLPFVGPHAVADLGILHL